MIATFRAELARLTSRRSLIVALLVVIVVGSGAPALVLLAAEPAGESGGGTFSPTVEALSAAGGGSQIFRYAAAFAGTLVFVVFTGLFAAEHARGTYRTMLLRQPHRVRLLAGKLAALLLVAAATLTLIEIVMWWVARIEAPIGDVSTTAWTTVDGFVDAVQDLGMVLIWLTGYAVLGTMVAVLVRSVPMALAIGIAWAGPLEHLIGDTWSPGARYFPGLLLEVVGNGGTADVTIGHAVTLTAVYIVAAAAIVAVVFSRRDVTA